jgi:8-oxo-dGTP pyrophosphatase MutT (NUDIX family)
MADIDSQIDAATTAGHSALASVRAMRRGLDRADAASRLARELRNISDEAASVMHAEVIRTFDAEGLSFGQLATRFGISKTLAHQIVRARDKAITEEDDTMTEPSNIPEPEPVVAAIVTSHAGVLIARRNDGKPPWTFIAGKIEPGESPADAAVREVKEETGLRIRAGGILGRRVHPKTGRTMVYMAARPTHGTDVFVGDTEELAEVRWATPDEADELMGGTIYEPVRAHLRQTLTNGSSSPDRPDAELLQVSSQLQGRTFGAPGRPVQAETREGCAGRARRA